MALKVDPGVLTKRARAAAKATADEMLATHGQYWAGRVDLVKLILSLSSAIVVGSVAFAEKIVEAAATPIASWLLIGSWLSFALSISCSLASLWYSNTLNSFRARFSGSELEMKKEAGDLQADEQEALDQSVLALVRKYSDQALLPLESADLLFDRFARISMLFYGVGLGSFVGVGGLLVV
ncbi:MAG: hypothetical protein ACT4PZ_17620 [Panacagrimonas sp.]